MTPSPDDLYILYTGGTTGMPKGVLWRQADIFPAALGGRDLATTEEWTDLDAIRANAQNGGARMMASPPFMHGAAHWMAFIALELGQHDHPADAHSHARSRRHLGDRATRAVQHVV